MKHEGPGSSGALELPPDARFILPPSSFSHYPAIPPPVRLTLVTTGQQACPYLPGRISSNRAFWAEKIPAEIYGAFMDAGFRRSGKVVYQAVCSGCRKCVSMRVAVADFRPSKSQRRACRRNGDVVVSVGQPAPDEERFSLYRKYMKQWHGKSDADGDDDCYESFASFLYDSPVPTREYQYRDAAGRLIGVGICDFSDTWLSSVYFYHDPAESRRSLGTFSAIYEIEECRRRSVPHYYLGYWVDGCAAMSYKASYRPNQILWPDGIWRESGDG